MIPYGVNMKRKLLFFMVIPMAFMVCAYYSLTIYVLVKNDIEYLIISSLYPEDKIFPPKLAEFYLFNFRGNKEDIDVLKSYTGLSLILNDPSIPSDEAFKYVSFFLKKGFDINSIGFDGLTALHRAVMFNPPKDVIFLLERGADKNVRVGYNRIYGKNEKTKAFGMNALELAHLLTKFDKRDRSEIVKILTAKE